ncbi:MAG TPA: hypothetical protein VFS94_06260 [Gemmatimonadales bacterium]|nr:hypothetical protein [Gemmatimonadales bacterium]
MLIQVDVQIPPVPEIPQVIVQTGPSPFDGMPPQVIFMIVLAALAAATIVLYPLLRAFARRIEGRGGMDNVARAELEELRARIAQLEEGHPRLLELEERVDFAERLLAQREPARLREGAP